MRVCRADESSAPRTSRLVTDGLPEPKDDAPSPSAPARSDGPLALQDASALMPAPPLASPTGAPITRKGVLSIAVVQAHGLTMPVDTPVPPAVAHAAQRDAELGHSVGVGSLYGASINRNIIASPAGSLVPGHKRNVWWLPYALLEFDKNEILLDSVAGDFSNPCWLYKANFDVSRNSELSLSIYLRAQEPHVPTSGSTSGSGGEGDHAMGVADVFLGSTKFVPDFDGAAMAASLRGPGLDQYFAVAGGTGQVRLQITYRPTGPAERVDMNSFELLKVIGKGSFGKVMQVRKRDTSRIYAMKTLRKAHIVSRSEVTHTLAERTVLAQVNCPFIVPLKLSFQSPDKLYLVLAFVNGGELFHHLQQEGRFSEERSRFYAAELLLALEHLHGFQVIYRDLKPENILLDYTGHIALCDFGLCKLNMDDDKTTHTFCGTPEYLSPEILLGQGYTKAVDWWTLGVLLYEMLVGLPPFYSEDVNEMYRKILQDPLRFPEDVHSDARALLTLLLLRDPTQRLGSGASGAGAIKAHPFFAKHIDWDLLWAKKVRPPFKPSVASAIDTSNFDPEFTSEVPTDSLVDESHLLSATVQAQFAGFSYNGPSTGQSLRG